MTDIDLRVRPMPGDEAADGGASVLESYQPTCVFPSRPVQRIAVLTNGPASQAMASAVRTTVTAEQIIRFIQRGTETPATADVQSVGLSSLTAWWDWADIVITDASAECIAESVERGFVPVVGIPKKRLGSAAARRALNVVHPWSSRGLALQLSLDQPAPGPLHAAAGVRTRPRVLATGVVWLGV